MKKIKTFFAIVIIFSISSCNGSPNDDTSPVKTISERVNLGDSLGTVVLSVPIRYDTSFSWINSTDCGKPCDTWTYRFQSKILPITEESGMLWMGEPLDSIDRLTITCPRESYHYADDTIKDLILYNQVKAGLKSKNSRVIFLLDTIQKIGDRYFTIFALNRSDSVESKKILATTRIKGVKVEFSYELLTKKHDSLSIGFINTSYDLIKTLQIGKP
jgi:hypothetical protein